MKQVTINITDMQSTHCQTRVNHAVSAIEGVQIQQVEAGRLTVSVPSDDTKDEVVHAVEKAGYTVSSAEGVDGSCCTN